MQNHPNHRDGYFKFAPRSQGISVDEYLQMFLPDPRTSLPSLDTPYSNYSRTNYMASGQAAHAITEIIHHRQAQLHIVTLDIATVELVFERAGEVQKQLLENRDKILASMKAHQGLISSCRRLPEEILSNIFLWCLPTNLPAKPHPRIAPLSLRAVCRKWRNVAFNTPKLWCSLLIQLSDATPDYDLDFYRKWLSLAGAFPLTLTVDTRLVQQRCQVLEPLLLFTSRVIRLHITFIEGIAPTMLLQKVPALEHLSLEGPLQLLSDLTLVQPEPRLHTLELRRTVFSPDRTLLPDLGWGHLTQLYIILDRAPQAGLGDVDGRIIFTLLALCPKLESFAFCPLVILDWPQAAVMWPRALKHAHLRSLSLCVKSGHSFLLRVLTLPELRHLMIQAITDTPEAWQFNEFKAFVLRSRCPLETLVIHGAEGWFLRENSMDYIMLLPTLEDLDLRPQQTQTQ